jgi:hypothetical protein
MITALAPLNLKNSPQADSVDKTATSWVMVFAASGQAVTEEIDLPRFRESFRRVMADPDLEWWPAPGAVLKNLPPRPRQERLEDRPTDMSAEERRGNMAKVHKLLASIGTPVNSGVQPNEKQRAEGHRREGR